MSEVYRPGAEHVPPRKIDYDKPRPILVIMYDLRNEDNVVVEKELDYSKADDRKYLGKLTFWAISNHHSIETISMDDAKAPTMERK